MPEKQPVPVLTESVKEQLLLKLWAEKKERLPFVNPTTLYVTLDSPKPDLNLVTRSFLETLSADSSRAESWARFWGRVRISVKGGMGLSCSFGDANDDKNKSFLPVETTAKIKPFEYTKILPEGRMATIILNNQPTTVEAFLISYVHMIDELIWDFYRDKLKTAAKSSSPELYAEAVEWVKKRGFSVKTASEEEILLAKLSLSASSVRLYGSGVNKNVPRIMGAVVPKPIQLTRDDLPYFEALGQSVNTKLPETIKTNQETAGTQKLEPVVATNITFGKELHAGHLLLLATADLLRNGLKASEPICLINNNTGPRAACTLGILAGKLQLTLEETAKILDKGLIPVEEIVSGYRNRTDEEEKFDKALDLLDQGQYDIFSAMARRVTLGLAKAGMNVKVLPESCGLGRAQELLEGINPDWNGSGFVFLESGKNLKIAQKDGRLTASGKCTLSMMETAGSLLEKGQPSLMVLVDAGVAAQDAACMFSAIEKFGRASQIPGAAIGFGGEMASGTKGEALTLSEILDGLKKRNLEANLNLNQALKTLVLTRPLTIPNAKTPNLAQGFYDYKDNDSFLTDLVECQRESEIFQKETLGIIQRIEVKAGDTRQAATTRGENFLLNLSQKVEAILNVPPEEILQVNRGTRLLTFSGEFKKLEVKLARYLDAGRARKIILSNLSRGITSASAIAESARQSEREYMPGNLIGIDFTVGCDILNALVKQGYCGEEAVGKTLEYLKGPKGLVVRNNYFLKTLNFLSALEGEIVCLAKEDIDLFANAVNFCLERLGYGANR